MYAVEEKGERSSRTAQPDLPAGARSCGQCSRRELTGGKQRAVFVYQIEAYRTGRTSSRGPTSSTDSSARTSRSKDCLTMPFASATVIKSAARFRDYSTSRDLLSRRHSDERAPDAGIADIQRTAGIYFRVLQEGEVGAGDEIVKVGETKERITVAEINALLYLPNHPRDRLERALRIEALSPGWRSSFEALLQSQRLPGEAATPRSRQRQLHIRLHQDFGGSRWRRSTRSARTSSR